MVYTNIHGGLGNQLFQYAIGRSISIKNGVKLKLDISLMNGYDLRTFGLNKFKFSGEIATLSEVKYYSSNNKYFNKILQSIYSKTPFGGNFYCEQNEFVFDPRVMNITKGYITGYWQSYKYFDAIRSTLLKDLKIKEELNLKNIKVLEKINGSNSVSLHIRRGDYVNNSKNNRLYNVFGIEYYNKAINFINHKVENPYFFVFSDDLEWASENINIDGQVEFVNVNSTINPEFDLMLMSNCKHNIIANSTFSWWAAYLNENSRKNVIAPNKWMSTISDLEDLYPSNWIKL